MPKPRMMKAEKVAAIMDVFQGNHKDGSMMVRNSKAPASPAAHPPAGIGCRQSSSSAAELALTTDTMRAARVGAMDSSTKR